ncbi:DUF397 domain-containing protein [Streptomyces sp. NPDC048751]|uniref:DUF397 domain-containing protein n=1 Tax=Streptomyces sp. NPDC048751 TaxID=3365591 RepID=UPI0037249DA9
MAAPSGINGPIWFTSSYSNGAGGECVECALAGGSALVRDSKSVEGPAISLGSTAWLAFIRAVKHNGES